MITKLAEEQLSQKWIERFLQPLFHCPANIILSLERSEIKLKHGQHPSLGTRFTDRRGEQRRALSPVCRELDE
jgi:hypothetical protein